MTVLSVLLLVSASLYAGMIVSFAIGWRRLANHPIDTQVPEELTVSVIVAARNEAGNIERCLIGLLNQDFPSGKYEIIVVDDHSEDDTVAIVQRIADVFPNLGFYKLQELNNAGFGKKSAIAAAIHLAKAELIITTDADCTHPAAWLKTIAACYGANQFAMISGPVVFEKHNGFWSRFFELDFMSLVASGAASLGLGKALMCNGANLAFRRSAFLELNPYRDKNWASGDDIFLMQAINRRYGSSAIHFLKSTDAIVSTKAPATLGEFINQRIRWGSKTRAYPFSWTAKVALIVFVNSTLLIVSTATAIFNGSILPTLILAWSLKMLSDYLLLKPAAVFFKKVYLIQFLILFQPIHALYITAIGLMGSFKQAKWKPRQH
jgi:cellulose synthase/poly-beta-1,6-N-acetylglucosamine synthase-like glycosyltransferase